MTCEFTTAGNESVEVASRAQQLLEHSLLSELHAVVARALSGLDMFAGHQLSEADLYGAEAAEAHADELKVCRCSVQPNFMLGSASDLSIE